MQRVRVMSWCHNCVAAVHLPLFAAAEAGLFAGQGIEIEVVSCASAPDKSLAGLSARPKAVAEGYADFALSGVAYLLAAQSELGGGLPVRFVAISHQRNPITAIVRADSDLQSPEDLPGRRAAKWSMPWYTREYAGALAHMGLGAPEVVDMRTSMGSALARGEIDVIPTWMDMTPQHHDPEFPIRTIALDIDVYTTGLIAADRLAPDLVEHVRDAFVAGYALQREQPDLGIAAFMRRFPSVTEQHVRKNWALFEPYAFNGVPTGSMEAGRWQDTIEYTALTHGLSVIRAERFYRPELLTPAMAAA